MIYDSRFCSPSQRFSSFNFLCSIFCIGTDVVLRQLLPYDLQASKAHAKMLESIKVLKKEELDTLIVGLDEILQLWNDVWQILGPC